MFSITRKIEIDAAHRVPNHDSKCKNLHGHRYVIEATLVGDLKTEGSETGMVADFGFIKQLMVEEIYDPCDHSLILWKRDKLLNWAMNCSEGINKIYVTESVPTAENLAAIWFDLLQVRLWGIETGGLQLKKIVVWETLNCKAEYSLGN